MRGERAKPKFGNFWIKGKQTIDYTDPNIFFCLGRRGAGKSAFLETIAYQHLKNGAKILDLFGSKDGEGLAWLRSKAVNDKEIKLIHGDMVELQNHDGIQGTKFNLKDLDKADIFISASPLYTDMDNEFEAVNQIFDKLWQRRHWSTPIFIVIREAANLLYSRIKVRNNQTIAKAELTYMLRESRHSGLALGLDSTKHTSIDIDVRKLTDYLVLKNLGMYGLPRDLHWVYRTMDPNALQKLNPHEYGMITKEGAMCWGTFQLPRWHKEEGEDIMRKTNVDPKYYEREKQSEQTVKYVLEALENINDSPAPSDVSAWIKENKGTKVSPESVGRYIKNRGLDYYTEREEGATKKVIKKKQN